MCSSPQSPVSSAAQAEVHPSPTVRWLPCRLRSSDSGADSRTCNHPPFRKIVGDRDPVPSAARSVISKAIRASGRPSRSGLYTTSVSPGRRAAEAPAEPGRRTTAPLSRRRHGQVGLILGRNQLGLWCDGAGESEPGDLPGEVLGLLLGGAPVEVVGPEILVEAAVARHAPDGGEHGGGDGADGLLRTAALAQALELRAEVAVLLAAGGPGAL